MKTIRKVIAGKTFGEWLNAHKQMQHLQGAVDAVLREHKVGEGGAGGDEGGGEGDGGGSGEGNRARVAPCRVEDFSDGILALVAVSPAVAVHIRQILPTLQQRLNSGGYVVRECRVGVARETH